MCHISPIISAKTDCTCVNSFHYAKLTVPVPAVKVTTVSDPSVALDEVKPAPTVIVVLEG